VGDHGDVVSERNLIFDVHVIDGRVTHDAWLAAAISGGDVATDRE